MRDVNLVAEIIQTEARITSGDIKLPDQNAFYLSDKEEAAKRETERKQYVKKLLRHQQIQLRMMNHLVMQANSDSTTNTTTVSDDPNALFYTQATTVFLLEFQKATIGAVSGNLTFCTNNLTSSYDDVEKIIKEY